MSKQVIDTKAGQSISAWVVLDKKSIEVGVVHAHYGNSKVMVDVFCHVEGLQQGSASGGGYDKFTAAIAGTSINGVRLFDNCGHSVQSDKLFEAYKRAVKRPTFDQKVWDKKAANIGALFANNTGNGTYGSLFMKAGLDRLSKLGYKVIQAI